MVCMTQQQFQTELEKIQRRNETIEYRRRLREERWKYIPKFTMPATTKIVLTVFSIICIETVFFCQYMIVKTGDTNALYGLITAIFAFMGGLLGYFVKSTKEKTVGGITYETAMAGINNQLPPTQTINTTEAVG